MTTTITIEGNVGQEPELRFTQSGNAVANFSVAVTERVKNDQGEWEDGDTSWFRITAWRDLAENVTESVRQGMRVIVTGRFALEQYEDRDGNKRVSGELTADDVGVSLKWKPLSEVSDTGNRRQPAVPEGGYAPGEEPF